MIVAFLILGCLAGLRFTPPALAWIIPVSALCATLAAVTGLGPSGVSAGILEVAAVQFGYFVGCGLDAAKAAAGQAAIGPAFTSKAD